MKPKQKPMSGTTGDERLSRGRKREDASFPAPPARAGMPENYAAVLSEIKQRIQAGRLHTVMAANSAMVMLYWEIGRLILERQQEEGWGAKVIDRLSVDLSTAFPDMKGLSPRNLKYMRAFAEVWPDREFMQQVAAQIPWFHNCLLLEKIAESDVRKWYIEKAIEHGWSRNVLAIQIESRLHERQGQAITNFPATLPPNDSDMAAQIFKDPYLFDFLGTADPRKEREVEQSLVEHIQQFLLELGTGFAFVGRQIHLEIGNQDFYLDLLFYHLRLRCYVIVELKAVPFEPGFVGQMNLYLSAADDLLRHPDDKPSIGLLLCKSKKKLVVEYALRGFKRPIGVADWETRLTTSLPKELKGSLPSIKEIEAELGQEDRE